jgi:16S rRNA processing protein RimM
MSMSMPAVPQQRILMGVVGRPHGVRGLVHVHSYAAEPSDLPSYGPLLDERGRRFALRWHSEGVAELAELVDGKRIRLADRTEAETLVNLRLYVERERLPAADPDEFYLADLTGLLAVTPQGHELGQVAAVHDHGGGTYLEIGALLLPFTRACVPNVDIAAGRLTVVVPAEVVPAEVVIEPRPEAAA